MIERDDINPEIEEDAEEHFEELPEVEYKVATDASQV